MSTASRVFLTARPLAPGFAELPRNDAAHEWVNGTSIKEG
jgi:hypothetical protein